MRLPRLFPVPIPPPTSPRTTTSGSSGRMFLKVHGLTTSAAATQNASANGHCRRRRNHSAASGTKSSIAERTSAAEPAISPAAITSALATPCRPWRAQCACAISSSVMHPSASGM